MKTKKCKPVLIESKENTGITLGINITKNIPGAMRGQNYQLILISLEDEKIEVGDKCYHPSTGLIEIIEKETLITYSNYKFKTTDEKCWICDLTNETKKVIATQDQISPEYITKFVDQYNNGEVNDVEIEVYTMNEGYTDVNDYPYQEINILKLSNGFITIIEKKEPTLYTEEEVYELFNSFRKDFSLYRGIQIMDV